MFREYKQWCDTGQLTPGKLHVWKTLTEWIINLPTKRHWRQKSRYEDIESGLAALKEYLAEQGDVKVALPALGCGHGGLDWDRVSAMIRESLEDLEAEVFVFEPGDSRAVGHAVTKAAWGEITTIDPSNAKFPDQLREMGVTAINYAGKNCDPLASDLSIVLSPKPAEREQAAALKCIAELARPDICLAVVAGTAAATKLITDAIDRGAKVVAWTAQGLHRYKLPKVLQSAFDGGSLGVASISKLEQGWNPTAAARTTVATLGVSKGVLVSDPAPKWMAEMGRHSSASLNVPIFYVRYRDTQPGLEERWSEFAARAVGRRNSNGKPNVEPIIDAIGFADPVLPEKASTAPPSSDGPEEAPTTRPTEEPFMQPIYPKRLIEVDLPIRRISTHARREKSIRHGHISTLHIWWARRPLAACRAVTCAALWPDPADEQCPPEFIAAARREMQTWSSHERQAILSEDSRPRFAKARKSTAFFEDLVELRLALLDFIADFSNWDNSIVREYLDTSRALTRVAHESLTGNSGELPLVFDPFAGGGSIPVEALRVGADSFASDLNPVPVILNKVVLEYVPKYGQQLVNLVESLCGEIGTKAKEILADYYPPEEAGATPLAYIWSRTVLSEAPEEGGIPIEIPLMSSMWLSKKRNRGRALRWKRDADGRVVTEKVKLRGENDKQRTVLRPQLELFEPKSASEVEDGTVKNGSATCPVTNFTTQAKNVRRQLALRHGGASDARLIVIVSIKEGQRGRFYRIADDSDEAAAHRAADSLAKKIANHELGSGIRPAQPVPERGSHRAVASLAVYGIENFGDLFIGRQALTILVLMDCIKKVEFSEDSETQELEGPAKVLLALMLSKLTDYCSSLSSWSSPASQETVRSTFGRQTLAMVWDFAEANPFAPSSGGWNHILTFFIKALKQLAASDLRMGTATKADATSHPLPDDSASCFFTDPPYYDSIPYAELADYFYVWLRQMLHDVEPEIFADESTPKARQAIVWHPNNDDERKSYEIKMAAAMSEGRRVVAPFGIGVVVFAHKSTAGWEAQLQSMMDAGWIVTASWPIDTERSGRTNANNTASLASSIHLVCRPRENSDGSVRTDEIGDWRDVLQELPRRIHQWMPRLAEEGVVGADAIFACLGPALEVFSRYSSVEKPSGERVSLRDYLEQVWAAVSREALSMIFEGASTEGFEPDARLTAMWLWTLTGGKSQNGGDKSDDEDVGGGSSTRAKAVSGFTLEYDAARKIAQGLGASLVDLKALVEVKGDKARLLSVAERTAYLLGKEQADAPLSGHRKKHTAQMDLFTELTQEGVSEDTWAEKTVTKIGDTVLDRVHQSMILFASSRGEAMKRFLVDEGAGRDARFWDLAQALSALYPTKTDEKRWVDGVLARKKGLGL
jgi:adenine-specific DNA methylase